MTDPSSSPIHATSGWDAVLAAVTTALGGEQERGRVLLLACWADTGEADHAQRCVLAHYLADLETDLDAEVGWDRVALEQHGDVGDGDLAVIGIPSARGMLPSLHLNLADGLLRSGDVAGATRHLEAGMAVSDALGDDGYGGMIRDGLQRLAERLGDVAANR